jgi:hypothetical protein
MANVPNLSPMTDDALMGSYSKWKSAQDYKRANPSAFASTPGSFGISTPAMDAYVQKNAAGLYEPKGAGGGWGVSTPPAGAAQYAEYMNNMQAAEPLMSFAGWLENKPGFGVGSKDKTLDSIYKSGLGSVQNYLPEYQQWHSAENARRNATGALSGTIGKLIPTIMGAVTGNPWLGAVVGATQQGVASGGNILSILSGAGGGYGGAALPAKITSTFNNILGKVQGAVTPNPLAGNAVPGIRTGVTTPAGGGAIVGTGQAAKMTGLAGGAPLGASPLAVAGGAVPSAIFPNAPQLGNVQPLPTGRIPGTNINVGSPQATGPISPVADNVMNALSNLPTGGGSQSPGAVFSMPQSMQLSGGTAANTGAGAALVATAGNSGAAGGASPSFYNELSRALGEQPGILHKTRPGAYFNALSNIQPRGASYA